MRKHITHFPEILAQPQIRIVPVINTILDIRI